MMTEQRIIFVNRFGHPDISATSQILSDLATSLATHWDVHLVGSRTRYSGGDTFPKSEIWGKVTIHRVWTSRFGRKHLLGRLLDYLTFYVTAPVKALQLSRRDTILVAMTDPPMISIPLALVARLKGAKLVNWVQDLFPEVATALGMRLGGSRFTNFLTWLRNISLRSAHANVVIGSHMGKLMAPLAPAVPVREIHNWSPSSDIKPLDRSANPLAYEWALNDKFVVGYSGNLGRAHELAIFLYAADRLKSRREIVFLIIGEGAQKQTLQKQANQRGLENMVFKAYQPKESLKFSLTLPDVHLVSLKPELEGLIVPSKFYSSIAAGRPVIFLGAADGELARCIEAGQCGISIPSNNVSSLANAIERLCDNRAQTLAMGSNARLLFEREFDQPIAIAKWRELISEISSAPT
jgi:glycosyltransferase involved in cell wall biosynthesis